MATLRFSRSDESPVDPFNAGEPDLPGGEPDSLVEPEEIDDQPEYAAHGDLSGTPHKPEDNYQAPTTRGHDYDAPSIDKPRRRPRQKPEPAVSADGKARSKGGVQQRTEKDRRVVTRVIVVLIILLSFGSSLVSCAVNLVGSAVDGIGGALESLDGSLFESEDDTWVDYAPEQDADDEAAAAALETRLTELFDGADSEALRDRVAAYLDEKMLTIEGYEASELGLDADELAAFVLEGMDAKVSFADAFGDGTASVHAEVTARSANELFWSLNDAFGEYLLDNNLWGQDMAMPDEAQREHIAAAAEKALANFGEPETSTYVFLLEHASGTWTVNEQYLDETIVSILGLY